MSEQADSAQSNPILSIILAGIGLMGVAAVLLPADLVPQLTSSAPTQEYGVVLEKSMQVFLFLKVKFHWMVHH